MLAAPRSPGALRAVLWRSELAVQHGWGDSLRLLGFRGESRRKKNGNNTGIRYLTRCQRLIRGAIRKRWNDCARALGNCFYLLPRRWRANAVKRQRTMPSSMAARVACMASSTRACLRIAQSSFESWCSGRARRPLWGGRKQFRPGPDDRQGGAGALSMIELFRPNP